MKTYILRLDDTLVNPIKELLEQFKPERYDLRSIDFDIDDDINIIEDDIAYREAIKELKNGEAINLKDYIEQRGLL